MSIENSTKEVAFTWSQFFFPYANLAVIVMVVVLVLTVIIAAIIYKDAEKRRMNGVAWMIVVLIFGLLGILIYLCVRTDKKRRK